MTTETYKLIENVIKLSCCCCYLAASIAKMLCLTIRESLDVLAADKLSVVNPSARRQLPFGSIILSH